jgi:5-methylcytosine-specific restriction enzyme B
MNTKTDNTGAQANWFIGASYGGTDDQMPRFLSEGIGESNEDANGGANLQTFFA